MTANSCGMAKKLLSDNGVDVMDRPAQLSDFNPLEILWKTVNERNLKPRLEYEKTICSY